MKYNKIYHLSHNDLDGYGSQYMTRFLISDYVQLKYFNTSYDDVLSNINNIFSEIVKENQEIKIKNIEKPNILFLITDLSINKEIAKKLNNFKRGNKDIKIDYQVLDHHKTGEEIAEQNDWYKYDINKCGASLTADFVISLSENKNIKEHLLFVGEFIQAHDIWEKESPHFGIANFLSDLIFNFYFLDILEDEKREFIMNYIYNFISFYENLLKNSPSEANVMHIENNLSVILNNTLSLLLNNDPILEDKNTRTIYKLYYYQSELYSKIKDNFTTFKINGLTCKLFFNTNSTFFQYFSHYFLEKNKDIDFVINLKSNKICSLRSVSKNADVSLIAKLLDDNGGGHFHASGCKLNIDEEIHSYNQAEKVLKNRIKKVNNELE